jgi:phytoene synthase
MSSRFIADADKRADVVAIYAFDHNLERARTVASNSLIAEIRLTWWREVLDEAFAGGAVRAHPVAIALARAVRRRDVPREPLERMIDARIAVLDQPRLDLDEASAWAEATGGAASFAAAWVLDTAARTAAATPAGRVWGLSQLVRMKRIDSAAGLAAIQADLPAARRAARDLSVAAFPAVAHAALARAATDSAGERPLRRQARVLWAVLTGRL